MASFNLNSKIVEVNVVKDEKAAEPLPGLPEKKVMNEHIGRPQRLRGRTYKLKVPEHVSKHSLYITINDVLLNEGTENEEVYPFEIFINSKNMSNFQWIVALTRVISGVFRKGGEVGFLVEELRSVADPSGGYWSNGKFQISLVAEIGSIIEEHLMSLDADCKNDSQSASGRGDAMSRKSIGIPMQVDHQIENDKPLGTLCPECLDMAVIIKGGCEVCLSCGASKCQ